MKIGFIICSVLFASIFFSFKYIRSESHLKDEMDFTNENLIKNGDFEEGNKDFESTYIYITDTIHPGHYTVTNDIHPWNHQLRSPAMGDHTSGHGNYMVVDSKIYRYSHRSKVWISNTIKIKPHTTYIFSAWVFHVNGPGSSTPEIEITIKDKPLGKSFIIDDQTDQWQHVYYEWNSGKTKGKIEVAIENIYRYQYVEDFAIDDIYFGLK
jgi:hypothetical protein